MELPELRIPFFINPSQQLVRLHDEVVGARARAVEIGRPFAQDSVNSQCGVTV